MNVVKARHFRIFINLSVVLTAFRAYVRNVLIIDLFYGEIKTKRNIRQKLGLPVNADILRREKWL